MSFEEITDRYVLVSSVDAAGIPATTMKLRLRRDSGQVAIQWTGPALAWFDSDDLIAAIEAAKERP